MVAVAIPVYNGGKYLVECLESIRQQTYTNWNCVIVDNRSTDNTQAIARDFADRDNRFRVIVNDDFVDQTLNWNIAFRESDPEARYFKMICADDWIFPRHLELLVSVMEMDPLTGIGSSYRIDGVHVRCDGLDYYDGNVFDGKAVLLEELRNAINITGSISTVIYRRNALEQLDYFPEIFRPGVYHIDTLLAYDVLYTSKLGFSFEILSYTRRHNETYTSQISNRFKTTYYIRDLTLRRYMDLDPQLAGIHRKNRMDYAYFLVSARLRNDKQCLRWHDKFLDKKFRLREYTWALMSRNIVARQLGKVLATPTQ